MQVTQYQKVNQLLEEILSKQKDILKDNFVGLYLYGSLATGDFDEKISDIDLLCAVSSQVNKDEFERLQQMHKDFAKNHPAWEDRVETQYVSLNGLQTFKTQKTKMANISPGEPFHIVDAGNDWLVNWYVVQERGVTLFGPNPSTIIDNITKEEFIDTVKNHLKSWPEWVKLIIPKRRGSMAYAILTVCRAYYSIKHGEQVAKIQAAIWMQKQFPEWESLIKRALTWREEQWENQIEDENTYSQTVKFVNAVVTKTEL